MLNTTQIHCRWDLIKDLDLSILVHDINPFPVLGNTFNNNLHKEQCFLFVAKITFSLNH